MQNYAHPNRYLNKIVFFFFFSEYKHRNLKDPYMDTYLKEYKPPTNDPKFIAAQSKFYDFIAKPLPTVRPMSPELENCVRTIMKHGIELFNALVFCIADREMDNKSPQEKLEPTRAPKKRDSRGHRDQKDLKDHRKHRDSQDRRDKKEYRQRPTLKPFRQPLDNVGEPEREVVNSIYDRVMLTIGLW